MATRALCASVSVLALSWGGLAHAQLATPPAGPVAPVASETPAAQDANAIAEVVVTGERRSTNLQTTPISAVVLTGADLDKKGVSDIQQLQFVSPSLTLNNYGQGNSFNIRGIGKSETNSTVTVGVVTYRDGVATFPGYLQNEPFYDIAGIEVLRGPQGTFAGQNATGGAVIITEAPPTFDKLGGYLEGSYGNYNDGRVRGAINIPLSDTFAARIAFNTEYRDSFYDITGPYTGDPGRLQSNSVRASFLWKPIPSLTLSLKTDYSDVDLGGYPADPATAANDRFHITNNALNTAEDRTSRTVFGIDYKLQNGITLRSITGYQDGETSEDIDSDGTSRLSNSFTDDVFAQIISQEFNIVSPDTGRFKWLAGFYYANTHFDFPPGKFITRTPPVNITLVGTNDQDTTAVFGQVSYALTSKLELQLGARYSDSSSENNGTSAIPLLGVSLTQIDKEEDSKITGKATLNYTLDSRNFLYAFVATGHKQGGLNGVNLTPLAPRKIKPEDVTDFELGWKGRWLGGHLRTQLDGYYNVYQNFQVTVGDPAQPGLNSIFNVSDDTTLGGVEAQAQAVFGPLSFDLNASLSGSSLGTFFAKDPRVSSLGVCNPDTGPATATCFNLSGRDQTYSPTFTLNGGVQYAFPLRNGATLTPRLDYAHINDSYATLFQNALLGDHLGPRDIINAQVNYETGTWRLSAYATNLTDYEYTSGLNSGRRVAGLPRQFGVRLRKDF